VGVRPEWSYSYFTNGFISPFHDYVFFVNNGKTRHNSDRN
jgi:hypothetical protein